MDSGSGPVVFGSGGAYDNDDLEEFVTVLGGVLSKLRASRSPLLEPDQLEITRVRIAALIFQLADSGIRDPVRLQALAEARLGEAVADPTIFYLRKAGRTVH